MRWQLDAKAIVEQFHVVDVFLNWLVPVRVTEHLCSRRQATDIHPSDKSSPAESLCWIDPIFSILHSVHTVTFAIKADSMNINLKPSPICQDKGVRRLALLDGESSARQQVLKLRNMP